MVDRLKKYMEVHNLLPSKFADAVGMPRSSFSQLMGGVHKTIKSETITKIHAAYPDLSIAWLLFGEGEMHDTGKNAVNENRQGEIFFTENEVFVAEGQDDTDGAKDFGSNQPPIEPQSTPVSPVNIPVVPMNVAQQPSRRITKIMVFYDDNTFESFVAE